MVLNVQEFIFEAEIFIDNIIAEAVLSKPVTPKSVVADANPGVFKSTINTMKDNIPVSATIGLAGASAIGYGIYRYQTSILKANRMIKKLNEKIQKDPNNNKLKDKLKIWEAKKELAQERARKRKSRYIIKTKQLNANIQKLNANPTGAKDKVKAAKLQYKLNNRMGLMNKIGATV